MADHDFICNVCGLRQRAAFEMFRRETPSCRKCHSTVRYRALIHHLSLALFKNSIVLPDFPKARSIRGVGMSDWDGLAPRLAKKLDYTRTYYDREPRLDLKNLAQAQRGRYDFVLCSEVLEHVAPPVEEAFAGLFHLLKPGGVLLLTVPYQLNEKTVEHFPNLHQYTVTRLGETHVLLNRTRAGAYEVFDNLRFHGGIGQTLEMRIFGDLDLTRNLADSGFEQITILRDTYPPYGVIYDERWSLPILARRPSLPLSATH